jgi:hypothetical protein
MKRISSEQLRQLESTALPTDGHNPRSSEAARILGLAHTAPCGYEVPSLSEFCQLARKLGRLQAKTKIDPGLPELEKTRQQIPLGQLSSFVNDCVKRVWWILSSGDDDDFMHDRIDELEILVWALERENTPRDDYIPDDAAGMVWALEQKLVEYREAAARWAGWYKDQLLHGDSFLVRCALMNDARYVHSQIERLLFFNVDRWICSRLGLPPDQWTTRLNQVLRPLARALHAIKPDEEDVERVRSWAEALEPFQEDLATLRFDSLFPVDARANEPESRRLRIEVEIPAGTLRLDGKAYAVTEEQAIVLDALVKANGNRVSGPELKRREPLLEGKRLDREIKRLPEPIKKLIAGAPGTGYWLKDEAWHS